jgi:hypothetical protein
VVEPWQAVGGTIWTSEDNRPLYKKPLWQGLTDDDLREMLGYGIGGYIPDYTRNFVNAIEAKLKEKNT